jgi:uroporphyrin-III C-methyltransferase/precorrin-2 dehydrogenase/sirohydrochlorin ferrochelatase
MPMRHFPIFLDLQGRRALVLGDGEAAARKADALRAAGAEVQVHPRFAPELLDDCAIAIGAEAPDDDLLAMTAAARARGIPFNVVDRPALCSFISPAVVDRAPLTIAVGSGGDAPVLARLVRARIEALLPPNLGEVAAFAARFRDEIRRRLPALPRRRGVLERVFGGRIADLVLAGDIPAAEAALEQEIVGGEAAGPVGVVYLVGAGPGAADLITLRGQRLLGEADVVVHDRLVTDAVLDLARRDAERIFVGKQRANHCLRQEEINALLVRLGQEGRKVVRLKGGDPFVFGRGGEEAEALAAAGVAFEVIPGVTAALACAAQARIPLTHREATRAVTLLTGHTKDGVIDLDFRSLVRTGATLAVYMGLLALPRLRDGLFEAGLERATPAALIEAGGTPLQRTLRGTLDELVGQAESWSTGGPVLILIGDAVGHGV